MLTPINWYNLLHKYFIRRIINILIFFTLISQPLCLLKILRMRSHRNRVQIILNNLRLLFLIDKKVCPRKNQFLFFLLLLQVHYPKYITDHRIRIFYLFIDMLYKLSASRGMKGQFLPSQSHLLDFGVEWGGCWIGVICEFDWYEGVVWFFGHAEGHAEFN